MRNVLMFLIVSLAVALVAPIGYAATTWFLPDGSTQGFDLYIMVDNTTSNDATIKMIFYTDTTTLIYPQSGGHTVPAGTRYMLHVNNLAEQEVYSALSDSDISTEVMCTNFVNIYAERDMSWPKGGDSTDWDSGIVVREISDAESRVIGITQTSSLPIAMSSSGS